MKWGGGGGMGSAKHRWIVVDIKCNDDGDDVDDDVGDADDDVDGVDEMGEFAKENKKSTFKETWNRFDKTH